MRTEIPQHRGETSLFRERKNERKKKKIKKKQKLDFQKERGKELIKPLLCTDFTLFLDRFVIFLLTLFFFFYSVFFVLMSVRT